MKPLFGTDLTNDKKNQTSNIEQFARKKISQTSSDALDTVSEQANDIVKKADIPFFMKIIMYVSVIGFFIMAKVLRNLCADSETTIQQIMKEHPWTVIIAVIFCVIFVGISFYRKKLSKNVINSDEYAVTESRINTVLSNVYSELDVPSDAEDVDVFYGFYKVKDGECKHKTPGITPFDFANFANKVFVENGNLCVSDTTTKYCIPDFKPISIEKVNKRRRFPVWNKDTPYNKGDFKKYKITYNDSVYSCKSYYILHFDSNGEKWGIYFPNYELPFFEGLTGLKAE